jgi:hypothetical protein
MIDTCSCPSPVGERLLVPPNAGSNPVEHATEKIMAQCQRCGSEKVASISGKCSDMCDVQVPGKPHHDGYVPNDLQLGGGDYIHFKWCMDCGQIQGNWSIKVVQDLRGM